MARWPISDDDARAMYAGGRGDATARWYARFWSRVPRGAPLAEFETVADRYPVFEVQWR